MDTISKGTGSSAWSQDPELMQKLDETYCKHLRPHIDTDGSLDGSHNDIAKAAWESVILLRTRWRLLRTVSELGVGNTLLPKSIASV